ncbi:MAG: hypothetical protein AB7V27_11435 [Candidatus Binatia bacterium]
MARKRHVWRNALISAGALALIVIVVVYSSFQVSDFECEVCMTFAGGEVCRKATGTNEAEGLRTAVDNACALLASGMTESLRCQRTAPTSATCRALN